MDNEIGRLLGTGATAEVFEYPGDKVVKLYMREYPKGNAEWEFHKTKNAYDNELPAPRVYELIEHDGRHGIIMERIWGKPLFNILADQILSPGFNDSNKIDNSFFVDSIKKTAHLLGKLHKTSIEVPDSVEAYLVRSVKYNNYLSEIEKQAILEI